MILSNADADGSELSRGVQVNQHEEGNDGIGASVHFTFRFQRADSTHVISVYA